MDLFINNLSQDDFKKTNKYWNHLGLNTAWSVGRVTHLIQQRPFQTKEEWESFYYQSGVERLAKIHQLAPDLQDKLLRVKPNYRLNETYRILNTEYGRTPEALNYKGQLLYEAMIQAGETITLEVCQEAVRFRVICETWNGVIIRERKTVDFLTKWFEEKTDIPFEIVKTESKMDYEFEVDYELWIEGVRRLGIQIKPATYRGNTNYLMEAKRINYFKNQAYTQTFNVPVLYVYSDYHGKPENFLEIEMQIQTILNQTLEA